MNKADKKFLTPVELTLEQDVGRGRDLGGGANEGQVINKRNNNNMLWGKMKQGK